MRRVVQNVQILCFQMVKPATSGRDAKTTEKLAGLILLHSQVTMRGYFEERLRAISSTLSTLVQACRFMSTEATKGWLQRCVLAEYVTCLHCSDSKARENPTAACTLSMLVQACLFTPTLSKLKAYGSRKLPLRSALATCVTILHSLESKVRAATMAASTLSM